MECDWPRLLTRDAALLCERAGSPPWTMLAGPHGEFELVFSARPADAAGLVSELSGVGLAPVRLGTVRERRGITLSLPDGRRVDVDMAPARNLVDSIGDNAAGYLARLREVGRSWGLE